MKDYVKVNVEKSKWVIRNTNKKRYENLKTTRYIPIINKILPYVNKDMSLLDIGIREGAFLKALRENNFTNIFGIDVNEEGVKAAKDSGFDCIVADTQELSLGKTFDIITMSHVLEHCPNVARVLENVYNHLNDDGILYIEVPKQEKEPVPTKGAHYYCFESMADLLSFFDKSKWEILDKEHIQNKVKRTRGTLKLVIRKKIV